jgi:ribonuclease HI
VSKPKQKFYVVWIGRTTGIFDNWAACSESIKGFPGAEYKSFTTRTLAEQAFTGDSKDFIGNTFFESELSPEALTLIGEPVLPSIAVDAAWNTQTGVVEYRGVWTENGEQIFHQGPFDDGTINIAEFLAIVHALAYCKKQNVICPIYSDSRNAIKWVRSKETATNHPLSDANKKLFDMLERALTWLKTNEYPNQILKWETKAWGENPADFGRK